MEKERKQSKLQNRTSTVSEKQPNWVFFIRVFVVSFISRANTLKHTWDKPMLVEPMANKTFMF